MTFTLVLLWDSWACKWVGPCTYTCFLCFPWTLPFVFMSDYNVLCFILILLYQYLLEVCLFSNKTQKAGWSGWEEIWGGAGRSRGRENVISIYYLRKNQFQKKNKVFKKKLCDFVGLKITNKIKTSLSVPYYRTYTHIKCYVSTSIANNFPVEAWISHVFFSWKTLNLS